MCEYRGLGKCPVCSPKQKEKCKPTCSMWNHEQPIELEELDLIVIPSMEGLSPEESSLICWLAGKVGETRNAHNQLIKYLKDRE